MSESILKIILKVSTNFVGIANVEALVNTEPFSRVQHRAQPLKNLVTL